MEHFQTPIWCCNYMVSLIYGMDNIKTILEPTPGQGNLARTISYNMTTDVNVFAPEDFWKIDFNQRYDAIIMNPPFTPMETGYKILYQCMEMSDRIVALMPWLTIINSEKRTRHIMDYGLSTITHLPRKTFAGSRVQCCILDMERGCKNPVFKYYDYFKNK